jgi:hypothetical protein
MILIECREEWQRQTFHDTIDRFHTYVKYKDTCNRRINWLVYNSFPMGQLLGAIGVNSAILALGCRDDAIGWTREQRLANLGMVANNYRFCMIDHGAGGQALSLLLKTAPVEWRKRYGQRLVLLETLVKPPYTGIVYRANGWQLVGMTKGFSFSKAPVKQWQREHSERGRVARENPVEAIKRYAVGREHYHVAESEPKYVLLKPLVSNWRNVLRKCQPETRGNQSEGVVQIHDAACLDAAQRQGRLGL